MPRHPLILDGSPRPLAGPQNCACTFYLVFKEPAFRIPRPLPTKSSSGEPYEYNQADNSCQRLFRSRPIFLDRASTAAGNATETRGRKRTSLESRAAQKNLLHRFPGANCPAPAGRVTLSPFTIRRPLEAVNLGPKARFSARFAASGRPRQAQDNTSSRSRSPSNRKTRPLSEAATSCARASARSLEPCGTSTCP
jgi:hypothetical protein